MIKSKKEYLFYLEADRLSMNIKRKKPIPFWDECWRFTRLLRKTEYMHNTGKKLRFYFYKYRLYLLGRKLGFTIGINVFGPGMAIFHYGTIIVNSDAKIGANCQIYNGVNITYGVEIGNNVCIGPGAKILRDVKIADNVRIGANTVVSKSILEPGITIGGTPARKISDKPSKHIRGTELISNS